jgi:hypothetical protein
MDSLMNRLATLLPSDEESKRLVRNALNAIETGERCALIIGYDPERGVSIHEFGGPHWKQQGTAHPR